MKKTPIVFLFLFIILFFEYDSVSASKKQKVERSRGYQVHRVLVRDTRDAEQLKSLEDEGLFDFWNEIRVGGSVDIMTTSQNANILDEWIELLGMDSSVSIKDVESLINKKNTVHKKTGVQKGKYMDNMASKFGRIEEEEETMDWTSYHSLEAIYKWFSYLEATFDFCETDSIGKSHEGQHMLIMKVCRGGCGKKPAIWIDSGIHAREWVTVSTGTWMLNELVTNDAAHPELTQRLDWYFLPSHNPDGYRRSRDEQNLENRFWRKSTTHWGRADECYEWECGTGADMNRNWGFHWAEGGASNTSCSSIYHGPHPFSEVEVQNVRNFLMDHKDQIKLYQTLHAYSQIILMPWAYTYEKAPRYEAMKKLALKGAKEMFAKHGKKYEVGCVPCLLYTASGNSMDWVIGVAGIPYAFCIELRDEGQFGFLLPEDQIVETAEEAWAWHVVAANQIMREFTPPDGLLENANKTSQDITPPDNLLVELTPPGDLLVDANQTSQELTPPGDLVDVANQTSQEFSPQDEKEEFSFWGSLLGPLIGQLVQAFNSTGFA